MLKRFDTLCAMFCLAAALVLGGLPGGISVKRAGPCGKDLCECSFRATERFTSNVQAGDSCCAQPQVDTCVHFGATYQAANAPGLSLYGVVHACPAAKVALVRFEAAAVATPLALSARVPHALSLEVPTPPPRA